MGCYFKRTTVIAAPPEWSMGYYTPFGASFQSDNYPVLADMEWDALTHIGFVGGTPQADGTIVLTDNFATAAAALISAAHSHGIKVLYTLGNEGGGSYDFTGAIDDHLSTFVTNIMATVDAYGFDGVDINYESGWNVTSGTALFPALRTALGSKLLTSAAFVHVGGDYTDLHQYIDKINVMTYSLSGGGDNQSWFNAALYGPPSPGWQSVSIDLTMPRWVDEGIPIEKLGIGIPFYGILSTGNGVTGPRQTLGSSFTEVEYAVIADTYDIGGATYDSEARVPWVAGGGGYVNWDNEESITEKINYVKANGYRAWIIWHVGSDYDPAGTPKHPLLEAVRLAR